MFWKIVLLVLGPLVAGMGMRKLLGGRIEPLRDWFPAPSTVSIAPICATVVASNRDKLIQLSSLIVGGVVAHNALGLAGRWAVGPVARLPLAQRRTLAIEVGMQNVRLGAMVATLLFGPGVALPSALFASWCVATASALAVVWRSRLPCRTGTLELSGSVSGR